MFTFVVTVDRVYFISNFTMYVRCLLAPVSNLAATRPVQDKNAFASK